MRDVLRTHLKVLEHIQAQLDRPLFPSDDENAD
jgi:hypothetical protein